MKILVTYQSKTGFTKKYAEWIAGELAGDIKEITKTSAAEVAAYDLVIHGGWIMGGMINGLERVKKYHPSKLFAFGVGFTAKNQVEILKIMETNTLGDIPFFYYEGGMDPKRMGFMGRTMVKMITKKTPEYADHTSKDAIKEIVQMAKNYNKGF